LSEPFSLFKGRVQKEKIGFFSCVFGAAEIFYRKEYNKKGVS
jgi:hypothetical protein